MSTYNTRLIVSHSVVSRNVLVHAFRSAGAKVGSPCFFVNFTLDDATFVYSQNQELPGDWQATTIGGRIFSHNAEFRWQLNGSEFDTWLSRESPFEGLSARAKPLKFYCIGTWNPTIGCFRDGQLPQVLPYPILGNSKHTRFYCKAVAYSPVLDFDSVQDDADEEQILTAINSGLNAPRCIAYRLTWAGVDEGMNRKAEQE
jgi:hypothetical protein